MPGGGRMKNKKLIACLLAVVAFLLLPALACFAGLPDDAVVLVDDGCSGVCVDSRGIVLTVRHCEVGPTPTIRFPGHPPVVGRRVYVGPGSDDAVAIIVPGDNWPAIPVAIELFPADSEVAAYGYPGGGRQRKLTV